ncbi:hypothetical protein AB0G04_26565 [Actinoplanes sp. NPDC023801]|uniref:hypothetical protein n=1 Tax=Actinoplanes sp. NPDC023801 TaxID=3154595 RepID=UPI0033CAB8E2
MPAELVRYDGHAPSFTTTVSEFAVVIHPLLGLSGLVAKVMASRAEADRLEGAAGRPQRDHEVRMAEIAVRERARIRQDHLELTRLEHNFEAALCAIKVEGAARRHEADRRFAAEMRRIDGAIKIELARLAEDRRRNRQSFAEARQRLRLAEAARRDIGKAMSEATRMMRGRSRFAEIAALTVPMLSQAMTAVVTQQQDGTTAVLDALSGPGPRALPGGRGSAGRSRRA